MQQGLLKFSRQSQFREVWITLKLGSKNFSSGSIGFGSSSKVVSRPLLFVHDVDHDLRQPIF